MERPPQQRFFLLPLNCRHNKHAGFQAQKLISAIVKSHVRTLKTWLLPGFFITFVFERIN